MKINMYLKQPPFRVSLVVVVLPTRWRGAIAVKLRLDTVY